MKFVRDHVQQFSPHLKSAAAIPCENKTSEIYANCTVAKLLSNSSFKQVEILLTEIEKIVHSHTVYAQCHASPPLACTDKS